jgi:hypothetical protein
MKVYPRGTGRKLSPIDRLLECQRPEALEVLIEDLSNTTDPVEIARIKQAIEGLKDDIEMDRRCSALRQRFARKAFVRARVRGEI